MEMLIGITLMGALTAGMFMAMRNGLLTMERTTVRLDENRRAVGVLSLIRRQISAAIPAKGMCPQQGNMPVDLFRGDHTTLTLVSSESLTQGARGYPQIVRYQFRPNPDGTVRLELIEQRYVGMSGAVAFCQPGYQAGGAFVLYDRLAGGGFSYYQADPYTRQTLGWTSSWPLQYMPAAVRIQMTAAEGSPSRMPLMSLTIPMRTSRDQGGVYSDEDR
jgi:hypothetical protein